MTIIADINKEIEEHSLAIKLLKEKLIYITEECSHPISLRKTDKVNNSHYKEPLEEFLEWEVNTCGLCDNYWSTENES